MVHLNILNNDQKDLLPLLNEFSEDYYLVGGTAISLILGHRESLDFDMFTTKYKNQENTLLRLQSLTNFPIHTIHISKEQAHFIVNSIKLTFFNFPYKIKSKKIIEKIKCPDLLSLAAMKAFALGGIAKWKDYVDLYFILKSGIGLEEIIEKAKTLFNNENSTVFSQRNFLEQLSYYDDVNYDEKVDFVIQDYPSELEIKTFLTNESVNFLQENLSN
jgi:hypothetical protein